MPGTPTHQRTHPRWAFAGRLTEALAETATAPQSTLSLEALAETLADLARGINGLHARFLEELAEAERRDLPTHLGATSTAGILRSLGFTAREATRHARLATRLIDHPHTHEALAQGEITLDQADAIITSVAALPAAVGPELRATAEQHLLAEAQIHDAAALKVLGKHLHHVIDPDQADERLAQALEREERLARRRTHLRIWDEGTGTHTLKGRIPSLQAHMLTTALQAFLNPALPDAIAREVPVDTGDDDAGADDGEGDAAEGAEEASPRSAASEPAMRSREYPELLGEALVRLIETLDPAKLPTTGGVNATVIVTMTLETLQGGLKPADLLGSTHRLSPGAARRLACAAGLIPAVLGGRSEILDLGRQRRLHTPAQRLALALEQGGTCGIDHCHRPSHWADAHHTTPWANGGATSVRDGVLLCPRHHTLAHSGKHHLTKQGTGSYRLIRRQ